MESNRNMYSASRTDFGVQTEDMWGGDPRCLSGRRILDIGSNVFQATERLAEHTRLISFVAVAGQRRGEKTTPGLWACADKYDATVEVRRTNERRGRALRNYRRSLHTVFVTPRTYRELTCAALVQQRQRTEWLSNLRVGEIIQREVRHVLLCAYHPKKKF